jgi:restriction system protein
MSIPDYQTLMLPLLHFAGDKTEHSAQEAAIVLAEEFALNEIELQKLLPRFC